MKHNHYFKSSLIFAASGLAAGTSHAAVTTINHNSTMIWTPGSTPGMTFDITGDAVADYGLVYADNDARKPQITSNPFLSNTNYSPQQIMYASQSTRTLGVLPAGSTIDSTLFGGQSYREAFFYLNWDQNYFGDWGGPGGPANNAGDGATPPTFPPVGPIDGYVALRIETDLNSGQWNYGYAHFVIDERSAFDPVLAGANVTLLETGYENQVNTAIVVPVPEPSMAALVTGALGVLGLRLRRNRR